MELPSGLAAALAAADEEYLIGLCNKGTVNRAKKDLDAGLSPSVCVRDDGAQVQMGDTVCFIRAPLGESSCSCPSSVLCRHRIAAILYLRRMQPSAEPSASAGPSFAQLRAYPSEKLARQLGGKRLAAALFRHQSGTGPAITGSSAITVEMPWIPAVVRLLEPLEHSTCTCRSRSFCLHKAEALLYWQLQEKITDPAALLHTGEENDAEPEQIRGVCRAVQQALTAQLTTGLSRIPPGVCETVERMASLCHTAGLPEPERALRSLHGEYSAYFQRSASFRDTALLSRVVSAFRLAAALENAAPSDLRRLAGTFRDEYTPAGNLQLYLLGMRAFSGRSGYAGYIYYFWERQAHRFYTFSDLRPTFYEKTSSRAASAPWELPCTLFQAWNCALDLAGAKVSRAGGLSSSGQSSAVLLGPRKPQEVFPARYICTDFSALLSRSAPGAGEIERLAVLRPAVCRPQEYDRVRQTFSMQLLDGQGRDLWLEVRYKKEEEKVVELLEKLAGRLKSQPGLRPVFFGILYREEDRLCLYPIEYFTEWEECP